MCHDPTSHIITGVKATAGRFPSTISEASFLYPKHTPQVETVCLLHKLNLKTRFAAHLLSLSFTYVESLEPPMKHGHQLGSYCNSYGGK